ncbi:mechanosensitive ion channel family protein [Roseovarius nitratireducens]|uniref:mechanosensitive ion channel family protein n=1 Tax=Roseovarius nitratireducens TaxID=2044597 RepID=UPI0013E9AE60|nr:mechanosensitive ion channel domain-containing protein [Roseovarius nitratireducens]
MDIAPRSPCLSGYKRFLILLLSGIWIACATSPPVMAQDDPALWYELEAINPGLVTPPNDVDRSSPRATLRSFVDLAETGDHDTSAHLLELSKLPHDEQEARGPDLAARLASVIDRKLRINWAGIPAEPDAHTPQTANGQKDMERRRDYLLEEFEVDGQIYAIRLSRYAEKTSEDESAEPVWLFSRDTIDSIDGLHDAFGPRAFEAHIPDTMKARVGWLQIWEWIALPLLVGLVGLVGLLTSKLVGLGRNISSGRVMRHAFERAALPLSLVTAAAAAHWLLGFIVSLSGPATAIITPALVLLAVIGFSLAALRAVDALLDRVTRRYLGDTNDTPSSSDRQFYTSIYALRRIILVITVGFSLVFVLLQFDIFADMGVTLLASAGVLTVILGIAGQVTLGNMVASLQIAIAKPVRIGDSIHYEGTWCVVEAIYFTFIRLRTWDERRIIVPVKYFLSYPFKNWSVIDERMICTIGLVLDPMAEVKVLREKFIAFGKADPDVIEPEQLCAYITDHTLTGLNVEFYAMAPDPWKAWNIEMRLREDLVDFIRTEHPEWWPHERIEL